MWAIEFQTSFLHPVLGVVWSDLGTSLQTGILGSINNNMSPNYKISPKRCSARGSAHSHAAVCSTANIACLLTAVHVRCRKKLQLSLVTFNSSADKCSKLHQLSRSIRNITTLVSRLSTEVVKRSRFSSLIWKRQAGKSLKADYKSVTLGFTPALSVSATSKWKNEWSRITPVPCQKPRYWKVTSIMFGM